MHFIATFNIPKRGRDFSSVGKEFHKSGPCTRILNLLILLWNFARWKSLFCLVRYECTLEFSVNIEPKYWGIKLYIILNIKQATCNLFISQTVNIQYFLKIGFVWLSQCENVIIRTTLFWHKNKLFNATVFWVAQTILQYIKYGSINTWYNDNNTQRGIQ
jgi:hypothetical protein